MRRLTAHFAADPLTGHTLTGTVQVFGEVTDQMGDGIRHSFAPTAFDRVLADPNTDVRAFWQHDPRWLLGRQSNDTVRLSVTERGLDFGLDLPSTSYAADLEALVTRGDLTEMSFGVVPGEFTKTKGADGVTTWTHTSVAELIDISPVAIPAFSGTSVSLRAGRAFGHESPRSQAIRARNAARKEYQHGPD